MNNNNLYDALKCAFVNDALDNSSMALLYKTWVNNDLDEIKVIDNEYFIKCKSGTMIPFNHILSENHITNMNREVNRKDYMMFQGLLFSLLNIQKGKLNITCTCLYNRPEKITCDRCIGRPDGSTHCCERQNSRNGWRSCSSCNNDKGLDISAHNQNITIRYLFEKMTTMQHEINQLKENAIDQIVVVNNDIV